MLSRADQGLIAKWWWTIEKSLLYCCFILIGFGIVLSFAASPAVAIRIGKIGSYAFVKQHLLFLIPSIFLMITLSLLSPRKVRRFSFFLFLFSLFLLISTFFFGYEVKGATRWINLFGVHLQPSEFMKPGFVIFCAICFSEQRKELKLFTYLLAFLAYAICACFLILEPDIGQTLLISAVWLILFMLSGIHFRIIFIFFILFCIGIVCAYFFIPHVHDRIYGFFTGQGNTFQVDVAREAILHGGWFGQGPGEGIVKYKLPDSHADFVFSVSIEEYGIILSSLVVFLFSFIVLKGLIISLRERDFFIKFSIVGLCSLMGIQGLINLAVNLHLMPAKGMTLPFISYGGSSMMSSAITMGLLLSLSRKRPQTRLSISAS